MDKIQISTSAQTYIEALRTLIRTGAAASPTLTTSCLINLPVVIQRSGNHSSPLRRAHTFISVLRQIIIQRLEGKDIQTALILFGFDAYAGIPIRDRYHAVAKLYSPYWTWENYRKEPLTRHLLAVYLALEREAELPSLAPLLSHELKQGVSGLVGQDWVMERFEAYYNFPTRKGGPLEVLLTRRLRAIADNVPLWQHHAFWRERGVSGVPQIALIGPGVLTVTDDHIESETNMRHYITRVTFPRPVSYGQVVEFTLTKQVAVDFDSLTHRGSQDWYGLVTLKSPADFIHIGLRFPMDALPRTIWKYEDILSGLIRPGTPTKATELFTDDTGFVEHTWTDVPAGYSYGISLEW